VLATDIIVSVRYERFIRIYWLHLPLGKENKWLLELIYMCLINIGDLYRYLADIYSKVSDDMDEGLTYFIRAKECYTQVK
jgi:hypothetical protein